MKFFLLAVESLVSIGLIGAVLLHSAKGEGLGGIGGQARIFNSQKDLESGLDKVTTVLAVLFLVCAVILGLFL